MVRAAVESGTVFDPEVDDACGVFFVETNVDHEIVRVARIQNYDLAPRGEDVVGLRTAQGAPYRAERPDQLAPPPSALTSLAARCSLRKRLESELSPSITPRTARSACLRGELASGSCALAASGSAATAATNANEIAFILPPDLDHTTHSLIVITATLIHF